MKLQVVAKNIEVTPALKEMVEKHNETYVAEVIRYSMSQNWQGIYEPKLTENKNITKQSLLPDDSWLPE